MPRLSRVLDAFRTLDVLVVGDALLDEYLIGGSERICREAPVPVVTVAERVQLPGGAANVAANVAALGGRPRFLSVVGDDADGVALTSALAGAGVDVGDVLVQHGRATIAKRRVVADDQLLVRFDEGEPAPLPSAVRARLLRRLRALYRAADVVIVSDYGYGVLDDDVLAVLTELAHQLPRVLVVDTRDVPRYADVPATALKPNYDEVAALLPALRHDRGDRAAAVSAQCGRLHAATAAQVVAVTLDRDGAVVCERDRPPYRTWTRPAPHSRACGAGDSYTSTLALALAAGADIPAAAELAQRAAEVVTARSGTVTCSLDDLRAHVADTTTCIETGRELADRVAFHRRQGRRIVFTNGCFDILHRGHVDLLNRAKALGDVLVVGVNSDESVRGLKGPERPINRLEDRAGVLAALSCVDHVVPFDAATASDLVDLLRPDVYVKGGDYLPDMVPEAPHVEAYGGAVRILPYLEDRSTTALIERIRGSAEVVDLRGSAAVDDRT